MKNRLQRIFENAREGVEAIAIVNGMRIDPNFFYITRYVSGLFEGSVAFLFRNGHIEVLTTPLEEQAARQKDYVIHIQKKWGISERRRLLSNILSDIKRIGFNPWGITHSDYVMLERSLKGKKLVDVSDAIQRTRLIKDQDEIDAIAKAAQIISKTVDNVPDLVKKHMSEKELKAEIDYHVVKNGANSPSFDSIVAFGENSALPHYTAGERRLRRGDAILVDVGAKFDLYCSDITRTYFFGMVSDRLKEMYETVFEAQTAALKRIRAGLKGSDMHHLAKRVIDRSEFKGRFIHSLGHSLGLEVHDGGGRALSEAGKQTLKQNMVLTVEPGIYIPGFAGVRIEDDVVVEKNGCRVLTSASKELTVI